MEYFDKSIKDLDYSEAALLAALPKAPSRYNPVKDPKEAVFRRNLVLKNLKNNGFINEAQFKKFKTSKIELKERKIEIVNEANSYTEEVRRIIKDRYGFEKLYTQGLNIKSPLDINYQIQAIKSLRKGIESYDRRNGWRGPITNKFKDPKWKEKIDKINLDPTLKWNKAEIIEINPETILVKFENKNVNIIKKNLQWALRKKNFRLF